MRSRIDRTFALILALGIGVALSGCGGGDPTTSGGSGIITFTTWGEDYVQDQIAAGQQVDVERA